MIRIPSCTVLAALGILTWESSTAAAAPSPKMLVEVADLSDIAISPNGQSVAFRQERASVERDTYDTSWYVKPLNGDADPIYVADGGAPIRHFYGTTVIEAPQWSADSRWIYFRALFDGQVQVWRAANDGDRAEPVTHDAAEVEAFTLSKDGRNLIYTVGATREEIKFAEQKENDQGIRLDGTTPIGQGIFRSGYINGRLSTQRYTGDGVGRQGLLADRPKRQRIVDLATLDARDATGSDLKPFADAIPLTTLKAAANFTVATQSPSSGKIAFLVRTGSYFELRVTSDVNSTVSVACAAPACRNAGISTVAWRAGRDEVLFTTNDEQRGNAQSLYIWDVARNSVRLITHADGLLNGGRIDSDRTSCSIGESVAICVAASANVPPRLERVDLRTGAQQVLYDPNRSLAQVHGPPVELLTWQDEHGQRFAGQFFPPTGARPGERSPLFITYYICPGYIRGGMGEEWPLATMASKGIAGLCINEPPIDKLHYDAAANYQQALSGIKSIVDILVNRGVIDRARVGLGGLSFGSEVTLWVAMHSDILSAASITSSSITPTYYLFHGIQSGNIRPSIKRIWGLGTLNETPDRWKYISPSLQLDKMHVPLLMQMPEQEYLQALDYFVPLANSLVPTELYVFPNEPHIKFGPRHKLAAYERNLDWFRFWLQGYVDPDPEKAEQYRRWLALQTRAQGSSQRADHNVPSVSANP